MWRVTGSQRFSVKTSVICALKRYRAFRFAAVVDAERAVCRSWSNHRYQRLVDDQRFHVVHRRLVFRDLRKRRQTSGRREAAADPGWWSPEGVIEAGLQRAGAMAARTSIGLRGPTSIVSRAA
jgi:hypothetical protein